MLLCSIISDSPWPVLVALPAWHCRRWNQNYGTYEAGNEGDPRAELRPWELVSKTPGGQFQRQAEVSIGDDETEVSIRSGGQLKKESAQEGVVVFVAAVAVY